MAWQFVGSTSGAGTSTGYTVSLNGTLTGGIASSPAEGDLVVVFSGFGNTASSAPAISGNNSGAYIGATAAQHVNDTWDTEFRSFYQVMGVSPDTSLTVTRVTNAAYGGATVVHVWRGVDTGNPFIGAATVASGTNTSLVNPPAYNPGVTDALIIAGGAGTQATTGAAFTGFTGMSNFKTQKGDGSTSDIDVAMANYLYAGVSYDPPVVSGGTGGNASSSWAGVTIAFRMAPPPAYTLTAQGGSYTKTGASATLLRSKVVVASGGAYSLTGQDVTITYTPLLTGYTLTAQGGSYTLTGASASLNRNRKLTANGGSYSVVGQSATLLKSKVIVANSGVYNYTGQQATITYTPTAINYQLTAQGGSYTLAGSNAIIKRDRNLVVNGGSYILSGSNALLTRSKYLQANGGTYTYTGRTITFTYSGATSTSKIVYDITTGKIVWVINDSLVMSL